MQSPPEGRTGATGSLRASLGALALFGVIAVALTWPLARDLTERLPAGNNDLFQNVWNFWSWGESLSQGESPYSTTRLFQTGERPPVSLAFHTHSEANVLAAYPLTRLFGPECALNLSTLLGFALAGWAASLLARELGFAWGPAIVAGIVFAYLPQHVEQSLEHVNLASYQGMPLFILFLIRMLRRGRGRDAVGCAAFFALNALYGWHNALMILPLGFAVFGALFVACRERRRTMLVHSAVAALIATALLLPFLWPKLAEIAGGADYFRKPPVAKGIDALFLAIPHPGHSLLGGWATELYEQLRSYRSVGFVAYLGWIPIVCAALGSPWIARRVAPNSPALASLGRERPLGFAFWLAVLAAYVILALGSTLVVGGSDTGVPLPFPVLRLVPFYDTLRVANRFLVPAALALSMLVAAGAAIIAGRASSERGRRGIIAGIALLVLADFAWIPFPTRELARPAWPQVVRRDYPGILLNVPGGYRARAAEDLYYQIAHDQPLIGGYTSCLLPEVAARVDAHPILRHLFEGRPQVDVDVSAELSPMLKALSVDTVVVHRKRTREHLEGARQRHAGTARARLYNPERGMPAAALDAVRSALTDVWGPPAYTDEDVEIYSRRERER